MQVRFAKGQVYGIAFPASLTKPLPAYRRKPLLKQDPSEPATVAMKKTVTKKKSQSSKRHNRRRAKVHRAKKRQDQADRVVNISIMESTVLPPSLNCSAILSPPADSATCPQNGLTGPCQSVWRLQFRIPSTQSS